MPDLQTHRMPDLQADYSDLPPLIHISELNDDEEKDTLDCSIYVANFPAHSLESSLQTAFEKYHVLDICMVNNGTGAGSTKAFLYLGTVYDVILAIKEMDGSTVFGYPLKVDIPFKNILLKKVVEQALS